MASWWSKWWLMVDLIALTMRFKPWALRFGSPVRVGFPTDNIHPACPSTESTSSDWRTWVAYTYNLHRESKPHFQLSETHISMLDFQLHIRDTRISVLRLLGQCPWTFLCLSLSWSWWWCSKGLRMEWYSRQWCPHLRSALGCALCVTCITSTCWIMASRLCLMEHPQLKHRWRFSNMDLPLGNKTSTTITVMLRACEPYTESLGRYTHVGWWLKTWQKKHLHHYWSTIFSPTFYHTVVS